MAHLCHARATVYPGIGAAVRAIMSQLQRDTFVMHNGSDEDVVSQLVLKHKFRREYIPMDLGE